MTLETSITELVSATNALTAEVEGSVVAIKAEATASIEKIEVAAVSEISTITILATDGYRKAVEDASGGKNTVIYDAQGNPNVMVVIPRFNVEDLNLPDLSLGEGTHPAFLTGGVPRSEILVAKYLASAGANGGCSVIGGVQPKVSVDYDTAKALCVDKGDNWHLMSAHEWAAITLLSLANETEPRGNTNYGRSHENYLESARRSDNEAPGDVSGTARTDTGKGPNTWNHNHDEWGVADLTGNVWEWQDQMMLEDGQIITTLDNNPYLAEANWTRHSAFFDAPSAEQSGNVGSPILSASITNRNGPAGDDSTDYGYMHTSLASSVAEAESYVKKEILRRLLIEQITAKGGIYVRNYGARFPLRGGGWYYGSTAGLGALYLNDSRLGAGSRFGFRPAFFV